MAIDPRLAAQQAQQAAADAAAAAKAAADAAAADAAAAQQAQAAETAAVDTRASGLAAGGLSIDQSGRQVLQDTGVTIGAVVGEDVVGAHDLGAAESSALAGTGRESLMALPDIGGVSRTGLSGGLPDLGSTFQHGGATYDKSMVMGDALSDALSSVPFYSDAGTADAGTSDGGTSDGGTDGGTKSGWIADVGGEGWLGGQGSRTRYRWEDDEVKEGTSGPSRAGEDTTTTNTFTGQEAGETEGGAVKDSQPFTTWWNDVKATVGGWFGGDGGTGGDAGTDGGTTSGDGGTTNGADAGDVPAEDAPVTKPKGWFDPDSLLGGRLGTAGVVAGGKGADPDGDDGSSDPNGPQGGDTTVNPGSEGTMYEMSPKGTVEHVRAVDWVGQPAPDDDKARLPAELGVIEPGPGPEVINPGSGDQANADAQASTASTAGDTTTDEGMTGDAPAIPEPVEESGNGFGRGDELGRGQGHGHGQGNDDAHGRSDDHTDDAI